MLITEEVPMLAGSDSGIAMVPFGEGLARELQLLVENGATPAKALRSAIVESANYLRRSPAPVVTAGVAANFCIVPSNPLQDVGAASRPWLTIVRGRIGFERMPAAMAGKGK
jgi:imidazolonepropionase-like amidohydrolase